MRKCINNGLKMINEQKLIQQQCTYVISHKLVDWQVYNWYIPTTDMNISSSLYYYYHKIENIS